ncbi:hypothetical protein [Halapricum hydrolyticum]|uniref:Uncharacterized protein n=1 Tax=Halapricum hydrolyticum TaxID=2979991 RepID=A0AAE3LG32_9EURY|nr:hypothetical protein [Halapricum hydrolyticum]MCU4719191.1 hypothetical protein [Halapricum hydrolyticum]MCU4728282.1 hypothetical protein [Halapricum hydrolyticum]
METTRRALLAGLASGVAASGCLRRDPERPPRTTVTEQTPHGSETPTGALEPTVVDRQIVRGPDGNVRVDAEIENPGPSRFDGYLHAEFEREGTPVHSGTAFEVRPLGRTTVTLTAPIEYEAVAPSPSLRLDVASVPPSETSQ